MQAVNTKNRSSTGLILIAALTASFWCSALRAHEVHGHDDPVAVTTVDLSIEALVREFRRTGDDAWLDHAWDRVASGLDDPATPAGELLDAAIVAQARHRFESAEQLVLRALEKRPNDDHAWLTLASLHLISGDNAAAARACRKLAHVPLLVAITCRARVQHARGDTAIAARQLDIVLDAVDVQHANPEWLAWSLSVAGDLAANSEPTRAIEQYERSLAHQESTQVRAALVDTLLGERRYRDADAALTAGHPALPLEIRRMIVAKELGVDVSSDIARANHEFRHWIAAEDWLHAREMARFYLDVMPDPALARQLAVINLTLQREPEDLRLERRTRGMVACSDCN